MGSIQKRIYEYETIHEPGFVGLAVRLIVWTPLLILTPGRVGISLVVKKTQQ